MTHCKKWEIVLVPFPFTDLLSVKRRPAIVVSPVAFNKRGDVIIGFLTSKLNGPKLYGDYAIRDWKEAGLPKPSLSRMKFATIQSSLIIKRLGALSTFDVAKYSAVIREFFMSE
jgi:mRNA interferase MazF